MELRHLRYFVAVADALSFRRAAERLHVAQPPLSRQIRDLEEEVGHALLERDRGGVRLTDAGRLFLRGARRSLEEAGNAVQAARDAARGRIGEVVVGNIGTLSLTLLPGALAAFRKSHPHVEVDVREMTRDAMIAALAEGTIDLALLTRTSPIRAGMQTQSVLQSAVVLAMPSTHRLARGRGPIDPRELAAEPLLYVRPQFAQGYLEWATSVCRHIGFAPRFARGADTRESLIGLIAAGYGCALAPAMLAVGVRVPGVVSRALGGSIPPFELLATWADRGASRYVDPFVAALAAAGRPAPAKIARAKRSKVDR